MLYYFICCIFDDRDNKKVVHRGDYKQCDNIAEHIVMLKLMSTDMLVTVILPMKRELENNLGDVLNIVT